MLTDYWHIQCIHPKLETEEEKTDYMASVAIFARKVGGASNDPNTPSRLVPEEVECSSTMFDGQEKSAIKIRFRLEQPTGSLAKSVEHFCKRVFDLQAKSEILAKLGLITTHSLMGVLPLSSLFKYHWTKTFLRFLVHKDTPVLKDIGHAGFLTPWFRGVTLVLTFLQNPTHNNTSDQTKLAETCIQIAAAAWAALGDAARLNAKEPPQEQQRKREELTRKFIRESEDLVEELGQASKRCETQRESGGNEAVTDDEIRLFNALLHLLECGFDLLTCEKGIFDAWKEEAFRHESNRNMAAGTALTGISVAIVNCAAGVSLRSFAFLGPVALAIFGALLFVISRRSYKRATREKENSKQVSTHTEGLRHAVKQLVAYFIASSLRDSSDDTKDFVKDFTKDFTQEEKIQLEEFYQRVRLDGGVRTSATKLKAELDSAKKTIQDRLKDMKQNEYLKEFFPDR
ncbi:hypothetical protein TWF132_007742 [Orbilia oligospora]|nr:hypothetical protein TWF132_007742 [Orbilia oligospora]